MSRLIEISNTINALRQYHLNLIGIQVNPCEATITNYINSSLKTIQTLCKQLGPDFEEAHDQILDASTFASQVAKESVGHTQKPEKAEGEALEVLEEPKQEQEQEQAPAKPETQKPANIQPIPQKQIDSTKPVIPMSKQELNTLVERATKDAKARK